MTMKFRTHIPVLLLFCLMGYSTGDDNWPQLRGPRWNGVSDATGLPTHWDDNRNIRWKTEMPGPGTSSPIVWKDNIYVTCFTGYDWPADDAQKRHVGPLERHLLCINRHSGEIRWKRSQKSTHYDPSWNLAESHVRVHGFTTNTPACDERGVYVFHGADGILAYSHDGALLWETSVGEKFDSTASAASLILYDGVLYVSAHVESQRFLALDARTGEVVWEIPRWYPGYATQIISLETPKPQLILSKNDRISAHDLNTGAEIWKIEGEDGWVHNTMLVTGGGLIVSCSTPKVKVLRADGSEKLWETVGGSPFSPILYDNGHVWWFYRSILHCRDAKTGEEVYRERIPAHGDAYAAPIKADGKIYLLTRQEGAVVIGDGPEYELLAHNKFADDDSMFDSTPAISGKNLILRSYRYLYCIGTD